mgnify:FL=1
MFEKFADLGDRLSHLEGKLSDPSLLADQKEYQKVAREHARLSRLNTLYRRFSQVEQELAENRLLATDEDEDPELREMARAELAELLEKRVQLEQEMRLLLLPKDPNDERNIFLEIRAGTGGDEAALFVGDLYRMYSRFAETQGWKVEVMSSSSLGIGGFKDIVALISGGLFQAQV